MVRQTLHIKTSTAILGMPKGTSARYAWQTVQDTIVSFERPENKLVRGHM